MQLLVATSGRMHEVRPPLSGRLMSVAAGRVSIFLGDIFSGGSGHSAYHFCFPSCSSLERAGASTPVPDVLWLSFKDV